MLPFLLSTALAAPPADLDLSGEELDFRAVLAQGAERREPVPPPAGGARYLDVYRSGDLAIAHDADGEWFSEALSQGGDINWILGSLQDAFFKKFDDEYDYLTVLLVRDLGFFVAFYSPLSNDVLGIGYDSMVGAETFDMSETQLEGFIFMNYYGIWTEDPAVGRYVFGQEFMHRWGSFVNIEKEGLDPDALLGRDLAHWSYFLHTTNSPMEGNTWGDNGDGTWTTDKGAGSTYSDLDLYLMGFVGPDEVAEQTLLSVTDEEADAAGVEPATTPVYLGGGANVSLAATPVTFSVDDIIAAEGPRVPSVDDSPKSFKMAFLVLVLSEDTFDDSVIAEIDGIRQTWEADWEEDVGYRADLITTLGNSTAPIWGEPLDTGGAEDTGSVDCCKEAAAEPAACACGTTSPGAFAFGGVLMAALGAMRRRVRA